MTKPSREDVLRASFESILPRDRQTSVGREVYFTMDEYESAFEGFMAGYAAGEEAMRERAAKECEIRATIEEVNGRPYGVASQCAATIRAIPITTTNTEGEQA